MLFDTAISIGALKSADNETLTGATLDMKGFDGVTFVALALKGEALDFLLKAQQGAASNMSDAADLELSGVPFSTTIAADGLATLEIINPQERYVRPIVTVPNAAAATPTAVISIRFRAKNLPQSNAGKALVSPVEGTAWS